VRVPPNIGKYRLERELGRGGMGVVWEAYDPQLQRRVAIKLMHGLGAESSQRLVLFEHEARAVARLQHPHVVHVYDYGTEDGQPYMVMELLQGENLAERLRRTRTMAPAAFLPLLAQIAKALTAAHEADIVHRDLKPGNIFLTYRGADVTVKILDFGIATAHRGAGKGGQGLVGTPPYMSPEQTRSEDLDHRTDLWSLAVICYQALTGQLPFSSDSPNLYMRICMGSYPPPSSILPGLDPAFDAFFARALAKAPDQRFSSAQQLAGAFARLIHEESPRPTKILVVDDEPDLALLLEQCFERQINEGRYQFLFAQNGIEGMQRLREHPDVDIALTDLRMPGMDGLTFLAKAGAVAPALRTVVISAYSDMENIRQAMNSGAFDFLVKPLDFDDLESTIEKAAREVRTLRRALQSMEENEALRMFVDPAVHKRLLPILRMSGSMAGERLDATVAIVYLRDQQRHIEDARGAVEHLNRLYDELVPVFDAHQGTVARFLGDGLLALFHGSGHCLRAVEACVAVRARLTVQQASVAQDLRIGIASGTVVTGSVGAPSKRRFDYAVFGQPVYRAYLLERLAEHGQIVIVESLRQTLGARVLCEPTGKRIQGDNKEDQAVLTIIAVDKDDPVPDSGDAAPTLPLE
jgi:eukaryotic-like serine/threonine-protein kinase